jgi:UDP-N-acetylmuramyl tripeptide synthase
MERFVVGQVPVQMILVKNPAGCNQVLDYLCGIRKPYTTVLCLNDEDADGHDISWIWDVDYEKLACDPFLHKIYVWGKRAEDLQLRLKYAGIPENGIERVKEKKALLEAIGNSRVPVYILPNYTTMLSLWKTLKKQAVPH